MLRQLSSIVIILTGLLVGPVVLAVAAPASSVTIGGRVYNGGDQSGFSGVEVMVCGYGVATTDAEGNWQLTIPSGVSYCARIYGNAPSELVGPKIPEGRTPLDSAQISSYENQVSGSDCQTLATCTSDQRYWDRGSDTGLDFVYGPGKVLGVAATSAPAPHTWFGVSLPRWHPTAPKLPFAIMLPSRPTLISAGVVGGVLVLGLGLILMSHARRQRKMSYDEYIRSKYYNL